LLSIVRFIALWCTGIASGVVFTHLIEVAPKSKLPGAAYIEVEQVLQAHGATLGIIEGIALFFALILMFFVYRRAWPFFLTLVAAISLAAMVIIWAASVAPMQADLQRIASGTLPSNWQSLRDRWAMLDSVRAIFGIIAFTFLAAAVVIDAGPPAPERRAEPEREAPRPAAPEARPHEPPPAESAPPPPEVHG